MTALSCAAARRKLAAFHDGELPVGWQVRIRAHLQTCGSCAAEAHELAQLRACLRAGATARRTGAHAGNIAGPVVARVVAERHHAWSMRLHRLADDPHVLWSMLGATAATCLCVAIAFATLSFAAPRRADSLAGILSVLASPGSNENPVRPAPHVTFPRVDALGMPGTLLRTVVDRGDDVFTLGAVLTREGRLVDLEVLTTNDRYRRDVMRLLDAAAAARFEPARIGQTPVAVNVVWLIAHTTVRAPRRG